VWHTWMDISNDSINPDAIRLCQAGDHWKLSWTALRIVGVELG
jgi:hypothetical protein